MKTATFIFVCGVAVAFSLPNPQGSYKVPKRRPPQQETTYDSKPQPSHRGKAISNFVEEERRRPYTFDYGVQDQYSGANFGHSESSDGKAVKGSYTVALPDGRIQRVTYTADEYNGFRAEVTYEGEAQYPEFNPKQSEYRQAPQTAYRARRL